jgi:hypothetical protein
MMWHPRKAAFRAGHLTIPAWDEVNIGLYSTAFGWNTVAAGTASMAFGEESQALGVRSAAFGFNTVASGNSSVALGFATVSSGFASTAMGTNTQAIGPNSIAGGANAIARAASSVAIGNAEVAAGAHGSFAFGDLTTPSRILADIAGQFKVRASERYPSPGRVPCDALGSHGLGEAREQVGLQSGGPEIHGRHLAPVQIQPLGPVVFLNELEQAG